MIQIQKKHITRFQTHYLSITRRALDHCAANVQRDDHFQILSSYFVIEIVARIHAVTPAVFFSRKWWFNSVDFVVVVVSFVVSLSVTIVIGK